MSINGGHMLCGKNFHEKKLQPTFRPWRSVPITCHTVFNTEGSFDLIAIHPSIKVKFG